MTAITRLIHFLRLGVGISDTDVEYADSTSSTEAPTTGWQTTAPKWQNGHFIWTRTHITYTDGQDKYTNPVCLPSGRGIAKIVEQYYSSTSGTSLTGGSWSEAAPAWVDGRYIWTRSVIYYTDGTSQTTNPVCATGGRGPQGDPGQDGKDAITITMSLTAICHHKSSTDSKYATEVKLYEGDKQVPFIFSYADSYDGVSISSVKKGDGRIFYLTIKAGAVVNQQVRLYFSYNDKTYQRVIPITTAVDGDPGAKGEVGATLRGPQSWSDLGDGYTFESGGEGDEWKDVVIYGSTFYSCIKDHVKTADNYPGGAEDVNNGYWRAGKPMEIIATMVLLSKFAFIKNLGAEAIEMYDKDNKEVVFRAYNGELFCKVGTFENVKVSGEIDATSGKMQNVDVDGDIRARSIRLKLITQGNPINGSVCVGQLAEDLKLPELDRDECLNLKVATPRITRSSTGPRITPATSNVFLWQDGTTDLPQSKSILLDCGVYDLVGYGTGDKTYWAIK